MKPKMHKLGNLKFKGKLSYTFKCTHKCVAYNLKKISQNNLRPNMLEYNVMSTGYDGSYEYPMLQKLFDFIWQRWCDHPVGEDVIFYKNSFYGYASDWINYLDFAIKSNFSFNSHEQVKNFYFDHNY